MYKIYFNKKQLTFLFLVAILAVFLAFSYRKARSGDMGKSSEDFAKKAAFNFSVGKSRIKCSVKYFQQTSKNDNSRVGWVSDIHADRFKRRDVDSGLIYPKKYDEYLNKVFDDLQKQGIGTVLATGDNTNSGDGDFARKIVEISEEKCMDMIWVKGNHDKAEAMDVLLGKGEKNYYYRDIKDVRIIVLDDTEYINGVYNYLGGISDKQLNWLNELLKTDKKVIVAMHIPIFYNDLVQGKSESLALNDNFIDLYYGLEKMLHENNNVKIVLSGHYHGPSQKSYNDINYYVQGALTRDGEEGVYAVVDLHNFSVDYKFAK